MCFKCYMWDAFCYHIQCQGAFCILCISCASYFFRQYMCLMWLWVLHVPYWYYYYDGVICAVSVICDLCVKHDMFHALQELIEVLCVSFVPLAKANKRLCDFRAICVMCAFQQWYFFTWKWYKCFLCLMCLRVVMWLLCFLCLMCFRWHAPFYKNYKFCLEVVLVLCVPYVPLGDYATFVCFCVPSALMCFVCPLCFLCNAFCQ